jgi:hypothetical protein
MVQTSEMLANKKENIDIIISQPMESQNINSKKINKFT